MKPTSVAAVVVFLLYGGLLFLLFPGRVILRGDDFGYVEAVVSTVQSGSLKGSDWLEPLNCPLTIISAGIYRLTGNFYFSTMGLMAVLAGINFVLLRAWLRPKLPEGLAGEAALLAVILLPVWLNKTVEFTGIPLGFMCSVAAWLAWRQGRWGWFFAATLVGFAERQAAVCLLVFPLLALIRGWWESRRVNVGLVIWLAGFFAAAGMIWVLTPPTFARTVIGARLLAGLTVLPFVANAALAVAMLAAGRAIWDVVRGDSWQDICRQNLKRPLGPLMITAAGVLAVFSGVSALRWETPGMEQFSELMVIFLTFFGAWLGRGFRGLPLEAMAYVSVFSCLVAFRGVWWDYYFLEPLMLLAGLSPAIAPTARKIQWPAWAVLVAVLAYVAPFKYFLHVMEQRYTAYEQALRSHQINIMEASKAPFGFLGWKLFHHARALGLKDATLIDFLRYVEGGRSWYAEGKVLIDREGGRRSLHPSGELWALPPDYRDRPLPLTNAEWRTLCNQSQL